MSSKSESIMKAGRSNSVELTSHSSVDKFGQFIESGVKAHCLVNHT